MKICPTNIVEILGSGLVGIILGSVITHFFDIRLYKYQEKDRETKEEAKIRGLLKQCDPLLLHIKETMVVRKLDKDRRKFVISDKFTTAEENDNLKGNIPFLYYFKDKVTGLTPITNKLIESGYITKVNEAGSQRQFVQDKNVYKVTEALIDVVTKYYPDTENI